MNEIYLELDLSKEPEESRAIYIRQGERNATTLHVDVYDNGEPVDLSAYRVVFEMRHPRGALLSDEVKGAAGTSLDYVLPEVAATETGVAGVAYFALKDKAGPEATSAALYATTQAFAIVILPNAQGDENAVADAYSSEIEAMLKWCRDEFAKAEAERDGRIDAAVGRADAAVERADAAAKNANDAADLVHQALQGELGEVFDGYLETKKDVPGGFASHERATEAIERVSIVEDVSADAVRDLAILRFNVGLANIVADEKMRLVHIWEFPGDVVKTKGVWDAGGKKYHSEVAS